MAMPDGPAAFMCYVQSDDQHDDGQLSRFGERLAAEVRAQTGQEFAIFQDRNDFAWRQNWQQRIDEALDAVTLLLVIITPSLFRCPPCRDEFGKFLERELELGRADRIVPVYYISAREIDQPGLREADEMATVLASRQVADWRELRFEPFTSAPVRRAIAQLALRMLGTFWQPSDAPIRPAAGARAAESPAGSPGQRAGAAGRITAKTEPPTHVVDAYGAGVVIMTGSNPTLRGNRIHGGKQGGVFVFNNGLGTVEDNDITGNDLLGLAIVAGANPTVRGNRIHDNKQCGVFVFNNGLGTVEDNDITANGYSGMEIVTGGNPTVRGNRINRNGYQGIWVHDGGGGVVEDNDLTGNVKGAWLVAEECKVNVTRARNKE